MNLTNLQITDITRIIAHTILPKTPTVNSYATYSNTSLLFSQEEKKY